MSIEQYAFKTKANIPAHVSALAFGHSGHLFAGGDDGTLRIYDLSTFKVLKAVRGLEYEVSSIVCVKRPGSEIRDAWIACGPRAILFQMDSPKIILAREDALVDVNLSDTPDDVLNELSMDISKSHIAFSMDSGTVGIISLPSLAVSRMETKHSNVCGCVKFIPGRPKEIVSGGYDQTLLHFDFEANTVLSQRQVPPTPAVEGISLSPPFITCMAVSSMGVLVAGTADGRLLCGFGGEKLSPNKKKRTKSWGGLDPEAEVVTKVAEGPIVAMQFSRPDVLMISTLLGTLTQFRCGPVLEQLWRAQTKYVEKVNTLVVDAKHLVVGGLAKDTKGVLEIWDIINT